MAIQSTSTTGTLNHNATTTPTNNTISSNHTIVGSTPFPVNSSGSDAVNSVIDGYCTSNEDCSNRGDCISNLCSCNQFIGGSNCSIPFRDVLGSKYQAFQLFFLIAIILVSIVTIIQTYKSFRFWKVKKVAYKLKAVNHLVVLLFCFFRILYFSVDPWGSLNTFPYVFNKFLYGFPIYVLFTAYELLLLYWAGTYHNVSSVDSGSIFVKKTKPAFLITNSIWFAFEVIRVVLVVGHLRSDIVAQAINSAYNIYVSLSCLGIMCGFIVYGALLYKRIQLLPTNKEKKKVTLRKLLITTIILSTSIGCVMVPSIIFYFLDFYENANEALVAACVVHSIELILVIELLVVMKPKDTIPVQQQQQQQNNGASPSQQSPLSLSRHHQQYLHKSLRSSSSNSI